MSATANPYQPPAVDLGHGFAGGLKSADAVAIRQTHLNHEAAVRSVGTLYYLSAFLMGGLVLAGFIALEGDPSAGPILVGIGLFFGSLFAWLGRAIRRLDRWSRIPVGVLSGIGLINAPFGTLINGYILYLFFGEKGKLVFSEEYEQVRAQTPEIQYRTPLILKLGLALIGLLFAILLGSLMLAD